MNKKYQSVRVLPLIILLTSFLYSGCMATIACSLGYQQANSKYSKQYVDYKAEALSFNIANEKLGLPEESVKEYKDWLMDQPLTINEVKSFHFFGVFSNEEAKELKNKIRMSKHN